MPARVAIINMKWQAKLFGAVGSLQLKTMRNCNLYALIKKSVKCQFVGSLMSFYGSWEATAAALNHSARSNNKIMLDIA